MVVRQCGRLTSILRRPSPASRAYSAGVQTETEDNSLAPKISINIKHIRANPQIHAQNCIDRNYQQLSGHPETISHKFEAWACIQQDARQIRENINRSQRQISQIRKDKVEQSEELDGLINFMKQENLKLQEIVSEEKTLDTDIRALAEELPNLTAEQSPRSGEPQVLGFLNEEVGERLRHSIANHATIGTELGILDFASANTSSGWGWYFLLNEAALLEQALIQYAIAVARRHGFQIATPPSMVYSHIASACGFRPRDQGGELQIYPIQQPGFKTGLSMAGTAEIPFAAMQANSVLDSKSLPLCVAGPSRCYRAEAGSRGADTKGLYRVHEFTKVEMFGWTNPDESGEQLFHAMVGIQKQILSSLGLYCRVLEQPTNDLGASAARKQDIEAFFPSRTSRNGGWGELTSTSLCTDYQTRRLDTKVKLSDGKTAFPFTVNGTALAVPRVLAAILETHWSTDEQLVSIPEVLWPYMHGLKTIRKV